DLRLGPPVAARPLRRRRLLPDAAARLLRRRDPPGARGPRGGALARAGGLPAAGVLRPAGGAGGAWRSGRSRRRDVRPGPSRPRVVAPAQPALLPVVARARHGAVGKIRRDLR